MDTFEKQNYEPVPIEYIEDEHDETRDFQPSFWWNNRRYYLDQFVRCHNNPWILDTFPEHIHAMQYDQYYEPLFLEIIGGDYVNIYQ
ncbi:MAG: hypothetical protein IIZ94_04000 [Prevotella sp.]|nr:hypothetical protein [Prevotella sp.]